MADAKAHQEICGHCEGWGVIEDGLSKCLHCDGMGEREGINIIDAVMSNPVTNERKCTCCGGRGKYHTWESVDGGCLNSYWRIWCKDCDHTDTNDIF